MINLHDSNITAILPESLAYDPQVQALGYAIQKAMQRFLGCCENIGVYDSIDTLPEQVIDLLAVELNTQYYDDTLSLDIKRSLVKNTMNWYMYTGTVAAVTELVESVYDNGEIEEWFDYGGEPYHFKVNTSNINSTDDMLQTLTNMVKSVQNVRSYLDEVVVEVMQQLKLYNGCTIEVIGDSTTIGIDIEI